VLLTKTTTGNRSTTPRNVAEYKTAWLSVTIVRESRPVLCPLAETHAGQKLKKRLQEADSLVPAKSHSKKDSRPAKPRARPMHLFQKAASRPMRPTCIAIKVAGRRTAASYRYSSSAKTSL